MNRIDLHLHTKDIKDEGPNVNISAEGLIEKLSENQVTLASITNHNTFCKNEFLLAQNLGKKTQPKIVIFPGIELDFCVNENDYHLLINWSDSHVDKFEEFINSLKIEEAKCFKISYIELFDLLSKYDNSLYNVIFHFYNKDKAISEKDLSIIEKKYLKIINNFFVEASTGESSSGVYNRLLIYNGYKTLFGSDIKDWSKYSEKAKYLGQSAFKFNNFKMFKAFLEKEDNVIQEEINKIEPEIFDIEVGNPENNKWKINNFKLFNGINIIIGPRATGKTKILEFLENKFNGILLKSNELEKNESQLLSDARIESSLNTKNSEKFEKLISYFKGKPIKSNIPEIKTFIEYQKSKENQNISKRFLFAETNNIQNFIKLDECKKLYQEFKSQIKNIINSEQYKTLPVENKKLVENSMNILSSANYLLYKKTIKKYFINESINNIIENFKQFIQKNTATIAMPGSVGFAEFANSRIELINNVKILNEISKQKQTKNIELFKHAEKGEISLNIEYIYAFRIEEYNMRDYKIESQSTYSKKKLKEPLNSFMKSYKKLISNYEKSFLEIESIIDNLLKGDFKNALLFKEKYINSDEEEVFLSDGEKTQMVISYFIKNNMNNKVLLFDEAETGLGNKYIVDELIPNLSNIDDKSRKIIMATHNANIAVLSKSYNITYRNHDMSNKEYKTYQGNIWSGTMKETNNQEDIKDLKEIIIETLEGGEKALQERGRYYERNRD